MKRTHSFTRRNGLSLTLTLLFMASLTGQVITGWHEHNDELQEHGAPSWVLSDYLHSGHLFRQHLKNGESEFLQMGLYAILTIWLRQQGSSESKSLDKRKT